MALNKRLLVYFIAYAFGFWDEDDVNHVLDIDGERNFDDTIGWNDNVLVVFCDPWGSEICRNFLPEFSSAADLLAHEQPRMVLAAVDCTTEANEPLCIREGVENFAHVRLFKKSAESEDKPILRSMEQIVKFMRAHCSVPSFHIRNKADFLKQVDHPQGSIIGFFDSTQGVPGKCKKHEEQHPQQYAFKQGYMRVVQALIDDYRFGHVTDKQLAKELFGSEDAPDGPWNTLMYHKNAKHSNKFESDTQFYSQSKLTAGLVKKWIGGIGMGICPVVTQDNFHTLQGPVVMAYYKLSFEKNASQAKYWRNRLLKFAIEQTDDLMFEYQFAVGARKHFVDTIFEDLGGHEGWGEKAPKVVIWDRNWQVFRMEQDLQPNCQNLKEFLKSYEKGELSPYIKSEEPPTQNDGPVTVVVGNTFREIVLDHSKDVFIQFYAPWCEFCKAIESVWNELGESFVDDENIIIAKMDTTANHPPRLFEWEDFPTIYWIAMGNKMKPIKYDGPKDLEAFISFIRKEANVKPLIINGEADTVDYDYDDGEIVATSFEEADEIIEGGEKDAVTTEAPPLTTTATTTETTRITTTASTGHDEL